MNYRINFFKQDFNKKILKNLYNKIRKDTWINGKAVKIFEKNLEKYLNTNKKVCTCNSGSDALLISLLLDKNSKKNIYLTTPLSYIASSSIAKFLKLELIYIDVAKDNYLLDLDQLEKFLFKAPKNIRSRIKGIINVEIFGKTNDLIKLKKIAKKYKLTLIGDCAQSFGTTFKNKSTVNYYDYSILSFYPTKILSCYGDGGALILNKNKNFKANLLKNNGHGTKDKENCKVLGVNSRLDSIQAFILNEKLKKIDNKIKDRKINNKILDNISHAFLKKPIFNKNLISNGYIYSIYVNSNKRNAFIKYMNKNKIQCVVYYKKLLSKNHILKPLIKTDLTNALKCSKSLICLPNHNDLNKNQVTKISEIVTKFTK